MAGLTYAKDGDTKIIKCPHCTEYITYKVKVFGEQIQLTFYTHKPTDKKQMQAKMEAQ